MNKLKLFFIFLVLIFGSLNLKAHQISQSFSNWTVENGDIMAVFSVTSRQVTLLPVLDGYLNNLSEQLTTHLKKNIKVSINEKSCELDEDIPTKITDESSLKSLLKFKCSESNGIMRIENNSFFSASAGHIHFARIRIGSNDWQETIFTSTQKEANFSLASGKNQRSALQIFFDYIKLGFEHILSGYDHLAFLMALLLVTIRLKKVLLTVTGFTLGHSITLALAALGLIQPSTIAIEALIGFTILLVASESLVLDDKSQSSFTIGSLSFLLILFILSILFGGIISPLTWLGLIIFTFSYSMLVQTRNDAEYYNPGLTLIFGLIHGFGFASVLLDLGLPKDKTVTALLGFNLGVEFGQILVVILAILILYMLGKSSLIKYKDYLFNITAIILVALGTFWFVGRAFGLQ